eukprot:SAG31_NODE_29596_length_392_cov_1.914676_1_plen_63_part_01
MSVAAAAHRSLICTAVVPVPVPVPVRARTAERTDLRTNRETRYRGRHAQPGTQSVKFINTSKY